MSEKRFLFYLLVGLILLLAATSVYWFKSTPTHEALYPLKSTQTQPPVATHEYTDSSSDRTEYPYNRRPVNNNNYGTPVRPVSRPTQTPVSSYPTHSNNTVSQPQAPIYAPAVRPVSTQEKTPYIPSWNLRNMIPLAGKTTSAPVSDYSHRTLPENNSYSQAVVQERQNILDSYMPKQTAQQKRALDKQLQNMSLGIEQAIAKATMAPKSKREQNLEKYMAPRGEAAHMDNDATAVNSGQAGSAGVSQQIAAQAQQVMNGMRNSYGDGAAQRAGNIMSDFQKEMESVLNAPGDSQEKALRAQAVNNKYNEKLQKLNQQEAAGKLENKLRADNEKQLAQIRNTFNEETEAAVRAKMEENLQKRMAIMTGRYTEEEGYKQLLALDEQQRKDLSQIVQTTNPNDPLAGQKFQDIVNKEVQRQIQQDAQAVQDGKKQAQHFQVNEKTLAEMQESWNNENNQILQGFSSYGADVQSQAQQILEQMRQQQAQTIAEGGELSQINQQNAEIIQQANQALQKLRDSNKTQLVDNLRSQLNANNNQVLEQFTKQMNGVSAQAKEQWQNQARTVLEKYNAQRAQLAADSQTNPNYSKELKALEEREWKELAAITVQPTEN